MAVQHSERRLNKVILALNAGSSSLKFGLFKSGPDATKTSPIALGVARPATGSGYGVRVVDDGGRTLADETWHAVAPDVLVPRLLGWIDSQDKFGELGAVGHRIVHGGAQFRDPVIIDNHVLQALECLVALAPLHQPACLQPVRIVRELRPELLQIACFDTGFHRSIGAPANRYALPRKFEAEGIQRYGFHGLSFESIAAQLFEEHGSAVCSERIIIAHLGSGASLCALRNLKSVDTTMGFSTLDGLMMGTRPGSIDPGILLYLMKERGLPARDLEQLLYRQSGLLGVSGISSDVETLLGSQATGAREALELFAFQAARQTAALAATLGGLDRFVFTGGIGEHAAAVRSMIASRLELFGARLDEAANAAGEKRISSVDSAILIEWRATQEEWTIARHVSSILAAMDGPSLSPAA